MIARIIAWSGRNRLLVLLLLAVVTVWGLIALVSTKVDAIPDLSDNQVIVYTDWPGRSPQIVEDQVTYPLAQNLQGLPKVRAVRALSMVGTSMIYVIFEDEADIYWARSRVLERLSTITGILPEGVMPMMGPDGTGVGHVYWYYLEAKGHSLGELRAIQDWFLRPQLSSVPGVAEVASVGGFVRENQIDLDPDRMRLFGVGLPDVTMAVGKSNQEVSGGIAESQGHEATIRGRGYVQSLADLEAVVVKTGPQGVPITLGQVATVHHGPALRRGLLDWNGKGEAVGGIVVMRYGANAKTVIDGVKAKLQDLSKGLPAGVQIRPAYDRSDLIGRAIDTLKHSLIEEALIVSIVIFVFLLHFRSALVIVLSIPVSVLIGFIVMHALDVTSNIMSLGGVAIAIGVLVDAGIVMVENAYRHLADREHATGRRLTPTESAEVVVESAKQVGRPIFFSLIIILLSFAPVFLLTGQEGKLFQPLALTKSFAMAGAALLSITLVPVLMTFLLRGRLRSEAENPVSRLFIALYRPILRLALRFKGLTLALTLAALVATAPLAASIGSEFMPDLDEGSLLFMPVTGPDVGITEARRQLILQDTILKAYPEVESVLGKVGRAETATDPAPVNMVETIVNLKPKPQWRPGVTRQQIISDLDQKLQLPGVANGWTQPIINRINMLSTGVRTDLGLKIFGPDLNVLERLAIEAERLLKPISGAADVYAERVIGGRYWDIDINREALGRYGLNVGDVQEAIDVALGGKTMSMAVEGRARFPIRVRYPLDFRASPEELGRVLVPAMEGLQVPLRALTTIRETEGPPMIASESGLPRSVVFLNVRGRDMGSFVTEAKQTLDREMRLPPGYYMAWSGQYENQIRAKARLQIVIPAVLAIIFGLLFWTFRSVAAAMMVLMSVPFALIGGVLLQKLLGIHFSVAVWVGYIALAGVAVETGMVMLIYLFEALDQRILSGQNGIEDVAQATEDGAILRLRPKLMTVAAALFGLVPILWSTGTGSDLMRPIAVPMIGGLVTSLFLVLIVIPILFALWKTRHARRGTLRASGISH